MNFEEHAAKPLLEAAGVRIPAGRVALGPAEAADIARELGRVVVKAQAPVGKRGKAGGILEAASPEEAGGAAARILDMEIGGHRVHKVLVEEAYEVGRECYAAVLNDPAARAPMVLFCADGGMDIEAIAGAGSDAMRRAHVDIRAGFDARAAAAMLDGLDLGVAPRALGDVLVRLYAVYAAHDAELIEINPLAIDAAGRPIALDCKLVIDDSALARQTALAGQGVPEPLSPLESRGRALGLRYIELDGDIGVLANGAGLTMTTMDVIAHLGGRPANFLEIGGDAYTLAKPAIELVLANERVRSLVVNFCGAFARTDVMVEGVIDAWRALAPAIPVFFSVHGTGEQQALALLEAELSITPFHTMDEAVLAAIDAARAAQ